MREAQPDATVQEGPSARGNKIGAEREAADDGHSVGRLVQGWPWRVGGESSRRAMERTPRAQEATGAKDRGAAGWEGGG